MDNGWTQYQKLVLSKLDGHEMDMHSVEKRLRNIELELAMLKVKASAFGVLGGTLVVIGSVLLRYIK